MERMVIVRERSFPIHLRRWGIPKGKAKVGEAATQCISREVNEEVGIDLSKYRYYVKEGEWLQVVLIDAPYTEIPLHLRSGGEIERAEWLRIEEVRDWLARTPNDFNAFTRDARPKLERLIKLKE